MLEVVEIKSWQKTYPIFEVKMRLPVVLQKFISPYLAIYIMPHLRIPTNKMSFLAEKKNHAMYAHQ